MILLFAGRRIDAENAETPRFPVVNVERVARDVERFLRERRPSAVVGSGACGADLLVLDAAQRLGIRSRVVLPFARQMFRKTSVTDRPGDWGPLFDRIVSSAAARADLVEMQLDANDPHAYLDANDEIFRAAEQLAAHDAQPFGALIVWEGKSRGGDDVTGALVEEAHRRHWPASEIRTDGRADLRRAPVEEQSTEK